MINGMHIYYAKKVDKPQKAEGLKPISKKASGLKPVSKKGDHVKKLEKD